MAAYSSPLDELLTSEGPVGEIARDYVANPPYPGETPEDTNRRQFAENSRAAQEAARADREAKQSETANRGVQFRKARDLAARQIPSYQDPEGQVQPVTDNTGSPLNFYDKKHKIGYDSAGQPKRIEYTDPEGPPDLVDPFEGVPVTTDKKTGNQYRIAPGLPWSYVGKDEEIAAKADLVQLDKQLAAMARTQGAKVTLAQRAAKIAENKHAAITKQLSGLGINVADETGTPLTFEQLAPQIEEAFNLRAADPAANKRTGWFNSGELAPEAQQAQARLAAEKQAAIAKAQEFHGLTQHIRDRKAAIEEMRSQHEAQLAQHLLNQQKLMGIPGLEDSSAQAPEESAPPEQPAPAGGEPVAPPASISEEKKTEPAKPEPDDTRSTWDYWSGKLGAAVDSYQGLNWNILALGAKLAGADDKAAKFAQWGKFNESEAQKFKVRGAGKIEDIHGTKDFAYWLGNTVVNLAPNIAETISVALAGGAIGSAVEPGGGTIVGGLAGIFGKQAIKSLVKQQAAQLIEKGIAKNVARETAESAIESGIKSGALKDILAKQIAVQGGKAGAFLGAFASSYKMNAGEIYGNMLGDPDIPEGRAELATILFAAPTAALDSIVPGGVVSKMFGGAVNKASRETAKKFAARIATELGYTIGTEGTTEGGQAMLGFAAKRWAKDNWTPLTDEEKSEFWNSMAAGAAGGGVFGGIGLAHEQLTKDTGKPGAQPPPATPPPLPQQPPPPAAPSGAAPAAPTGIPGIGVDDTGTAPVEDAADGYDAFSGVQPAPPAAPAAPHPTMPPDEGSMAAAPMPVEEMPPGDMSAQPETLKPDGLSIPGLEPVTVPTDTETAPEAAAEPDAVAEIPELPTHLADAIAAEHAPDVIRDHTRLHFGEDAAQGAKSTKPTESQLRVLEQAKAHAKSKGWKWDDVVEKARQQLGLDADFLKPKSHEANTLAIMREQEVKIKERTALFEKQAAERQAELDAENKRKSDEAEAVKKASDAKIKAEMEAATKASEASTAKTHDDIVAKLKPNMIQRWKTTPTKKGQGALLNAIMVGSGTRNEQALRDALDRAAQHPAPSAPEPPPAAATVAPAPAAVAAKPSSKFAFKEETPFYQDQLISYIVENGGINPKSDDLPELHPPPKDRGYPSHQHVFKETGKSMDEMAGRLRHESWIPEDYTSVDLQRDIYNASKSARHIEEAMKSAKEDEKQQTAFHKDTSTKGPKEKELTALDVNVGDVIQVGSEKMKVIAVDDATASFTLEDGQKYGTRTVSDGDHIFGKLVKPPKEKETAKPESFSLEKPESPDEQRARLEAAQKARDEAKAKEDMKAKAAAPLKGSAGETTADMFGEGDTPLFNEQRDKPKADEPKPFGSQNKIISNDRAEELRGRIKKKLGQNLTIGVDPTIFSDAVQLGAYYIEAGYHRFAEWSAKMLADFGAAIQEHLKSIYETAKVTIESPVGESVKGRPAGLEPGLRPPTERIVTARAEHTQHADESVIPSDLIQHLDEHQRQGAAAGIVSMEKIGGFLNADGTGAGKTRQALTVAAHYSRQGKRVVIVTKSETIKQDWKNNTFGGSYGFDSKAMGIPLDLVRDGNVQPGKIGITTYQNLSDVERNSGPDTVLIFDEAHALKNDSQQAKYGMGAAQRANKVMFMSATPADKAEHIYYLAGIGIMEGKTIQKALEDLGMQLVKIQKRDRKTGRQYEVKFWAPDQKVSDTERNARFSALFNRMTAKGAMIKREISMDGVHVNMLRVSLPPEGHDVQQDILNFFDARTVDDLEGLKKAIVLGHMRRQQEPFKIASTVMLAQRELAQGRQVVIFVSRVNASEVGKWVKGMSMPGMESERYREILMSSEGTAKSLVEALRDAGINDVAEIHGNADQNSIDAMADFQGGRKRVVVATIESGGTGINLDDTLGNRPRSMIIVTAPFDAVGNVQAAGRIWRLKTLSGANLFYLFGDTDVDEWNKDIIGSKMATLGAVVEGQVRRLDVSDPDQVDLDQFHSSVQPEPEAAQEGGAMPKLDWKPFKTKAGKDKWVADATPEFWTWYRKNGSKDNPEGVSVSKWNDKWQVWSNKDRSSTALEAAAPSGGPAAPPEQDRAESTATRNAAPGTGTRYAVPSPERSPLSPEDAETVRNGIESDAPPTPELLAVQRKATVEAARKIGADPTGALRAQSVFRDFMSGRDTRETRKEVTGLTPPLDAQLRAAMLTNQALWRAARGDSPVPVVRIRLISELRKELGQEIPTAEGTRIRKVAPDLHPLVSFSESLTAFCKP